MWESRPATAAECTLLFTKLSHQGEHALNATHEHSAEELITDVLTPSQDPVQVLFFLPEEAATLYALKLTGFEADTHQVHGFVIEYIGYIKDPHTMRPVALRLGVCEKRMLQLYVKRGR